MRVLVCGGRDFENYTRVHQLLDGVHERHGITELIHGGARGTDSLAKQWADANKVTSRAFPADWEKYGKAAGMIRNKQMLLEGPRLVVAFPGGRGTANMIALAEKLGILVIRG